MTAFVIKFLTTKISENFWYFMKFLIFQIFPLTHEKKQKDWFNKAKSYHWCERWIKFDCGENNYGSSIGLLSNEILIEK